MNTPILYQVVERGKTPIPVMIRPELGEIEPRHADMLRYDLGFCNPQDVSEVVFPIFHVRNEGRSTQKITHARWSSFVLELNQKSHYTGAMEDWFTYVRPTPTSELQRQTIREYLAAHPRLKIVGWR